MPYNKNEEYETLQQNVLDILGHGSMAAMNLHVLASTRAFHEIAHHLNELSGKICDAVDEMLECCDFLEETEQIAQCVQSGIMDTKDLRDVLKQYKELRSTKQEHTVLPNEEEGE